MLPQITVYLEPGQVESLEARARGKKVSISSEVRAAVREYLARTTAQVQDAQAAPVLHGMLQEQFHELEIWLRPMLAATSINSATTVLLALEILCGSRVDPNKAKETLDVMRGRAYRMLRKRDAGDAGGTT